ncbi:glycosyltransferase [Parabacteroides distasonis]|nr:glycosyltransferase [Parabacteroides distasonis]
MLNNQRPNSKLLLIGGGKPKVEQKYKNEVMKKIKEQGLENKVKFLGVRDNIEELLQVMDVLVMPSTSEGFPVTLVEAQAAGVRCIASDRIDYKVNITDEIQYEALESDAVDWANRIISFTILNLMLRK